MPKQIVVLECAPGEPCPGDLIEGVLEGTGLEVRKPVLVTEVHWRWDYDDVPEEHWQEIQPILKQRIEALYHQGVIRAGAWEDAEDED